MDSNSKKEYRRIIISYFFNIVINSRISPIISDIKKGLQL